MPANTTLALMVVTGGALAVWVGIKDPEGGISGALSTVLAGGKLAASSAKSFGGGGSFAERSAYITQSAFTKGGTSTSGGTTSAGPAASGSGAAVVAAARTQLGVPYSFGAEQPGKAFDCSGLTWWAYSQVGTQLPRVAAAQALQGSAVSLDALAPGDLVFWGAPAGHVAIATGEGRQVIHAPHTGAVVREATIWSPGTAYARRILTGATAAKTWST